MTPVRWIAAGAAASAVLAFAAQALADCAVTMSPTPGNLGKIVANTTRNGSPNSSVATTFTIPSTGGVVTQNPPAASTGAATLLRPPSNFGWRVTITSGSGCSGTSTNIPTRLTASSTKFTFPATTFTISGVSGGSVSTTTLANGAPFSIGFGQAGNNRTMQFDVGMGVTLPANSTPGAAAWTVTVAVQ